MRFNKVLFGILFFSPILDASQAQQQLQQQINLLQQQTQALQSQLAHLQNQLTSQNEEKKRLSRLALKKHSLQQNHHKNLKTRVRCFIHAT